MMRNFRNILWLALAAFALLGSTFAQQQDRDLGPMEYGARTPQPVNQIIDRFAAREKEFAQAREQYTYHEAATVQTLDENGSVNGRYSESFDVTFDDQGNRITRNEQESPSTLKVQITPEDKDDLRNRMPFVMTSDDLPEYNVDYVGQQTLGGRNTYVFNIDPKSLAGDKRYFQGKIWVDAQDFQIVRSFGKAVPDIRGYSSGGAGGGWGGGRGRRSDDSSNENLFPQFTTYRELIDGKYWFPVRTLSDDTLYFSGGPVRIREQVDYTNYKRFGSQSKIIFNGQEVERGDSSGSGQQPTTQQRSGAVYGAGNSNGGVTPQQQGAQRQPSAATGPRPATSSAAVPGSSGAPRDTLTLEQQAIALEQLYEKDWNTHTHDAFNNLLEEGFEFVNQRGDVLAREDFLSTAAASRQDIDINTNALDVRVYGPTMVIVGKQTSGATSYRFTHVYVQRGGNWQLFSAQLSPSSGR